MTKEDFIYEIYEFLGRFQALQYLLQKAIERKDLEEISYIQQRIASINKDLENLLDSESF